MAVEALVSQYQEDACWSDIDVIELLIEYIDNQQDDGALADFLARKAAEA